jgi:hypothetical protein
MVLQVLTLMPLRTIMNYRAFLIASQVSLDRLAHNFVYHFRSQSIEMVARSRDRSTTSRLPADSRGIHFPFLVSFPSPPMMPTSTFFSLCKILRWPPRCTLPGTSLAIRRYRCERRNHRPSRDGRASVRLPSFLGGLFASQYQS